MLLDVNRFWKHLSVDTKYTLIYLSIILCSMFIILMIIGTSIIVYNTLREVYFL